MGLGLPPEGITFIPNIMEIGGGLKVESGRDTA
jgi:hypothetical protein